MSIVGMPQTISDAWATFKHYEKVKKWVESEAEIDRQLVLALSPTVFKPKWGGRYLYTDGCFVQVMSIGDPSPENPGRQGIPYRKDLRLMDDILDIPVGENSCIMITQTAIPLPPTDEQESLEAAKRRNLLAKIQQDQDAENAGIKVHDSILDYVGQGIEEYNRALYEGRTRLFEFSLLLAVKGKTTKDVDDTMSSIITMLESKKLIYEIIEHGQVDAFRSMMPTPYIKERLLSTTTGDIVALTCPLKSRNPKLADSGRFLGIDEKTNNPLFLNYKDGSLVSGHAIVVGKSGSGKSTELLKDDKRALEEGDEAFHIVPKADQDTNHKRVCIEMGGLLIDIGNGDGKRNFNMFQVFFDKTRMENSLGAYQTAYSRHIMNLTESIGLLIGRGFTDAQRNWVYNSLDELYCRFHVIDIDGNVINTEFWETNRLPDGNKLFPNFEDWRALIFEWMNDDAHRAPQINSVIAAIYNNTSMITRRGPLRFLITDDILRLDNRFTMVDISDLIDTPNIQDAIILMVIGILNTKIQCVPAGSEKKHIFITLDEGANLVKIPRMRKVIEKLFRELRSFGGHLKIVFQDLAGVSPSMVNMMKTNTDYVLLMSNMSAYNVKPLVKEFNLTKNDIRRLRTPGRGKGVLIIGDTHIDYVNALTVDDQRVIFDKEVDEDQYMLEASGAVVKIDERVDWVKNNHGIIVKDWITNQDLKKVIKIPGYEMERFEHPFRPGKKIIYIKEGIKTEDGDIKIKIFDAETKKIKIKNQSDWHYKFVYSLGGELSLMDFTVTADDYGRTKLTDLDKHEQQADLIARKILAPGVEIRIAVEVEKRGSHTIKQLREKRDRLLNRKNPDGSPVFDTVIFTSDNDYWKSTLVGAVGDEYSAPRGKELKNKFLSACETKIQALGLDSETVSGDEDETLDSANPAESVLNLTEPEPLSSPI